MNTMNNSNINNDALAELRYGMTTLKNSLPQSGLIDERQIRQAMNSRSRWLKNFVWAEIIVLAIATLILLAATVAFHMSPWCVIVLIILAVPDIILDTRTVPVSKKWIQEEPLVTLLKKLTRQKVERQWQTLIEMPLAIGWLVWFLYEYLKHQPAIPADMFVWVWGITAGVSVIATTLIVWYIYRKIQRINDEMIERLKDFEGKSA